MLIDGVASKGWHDGPPTYQQSPEGNPDDVAYLHFSKAFDKVHWGQLLRKIEGHNINGEILIGYPAGLSTENKEW